MSIRAKALSALRARTIQPVEVSSPLEYFEWWTASRLVLCEAMGHNNMFLAF